jgi:hypothetical protein
VRRSRRSRAAWTPATARSCAPTPAQAALDKRKTSALIADIGFIVGGIAAAALIGVIVAKSMKKKSKASSPTPTRAQVVPYANPRGGGLGFSFRF